MKINPTKRKLFLFVLGHFTPPPLFRILRVDPGTHATEGKDSVRRKPFSASKTGFGDAPDLRKDALGEPKDEEVRSTRRCSSRSFRCVPTSSSLRFSDEFCLSGPAHLSAYALNWTHTKMDVRKRKKRLVSAEVVRHQRRVDGLKQILDV